MIEAELKARLIDPEPARAALDRKSVAEKATYHDTYYDTADGQLEKDGRELRLRTVKSAAAARHFLTFKEAAVDEASGSKPEYETTVDTPSAVAHMVEALGYGPAIELTKECENYRFTVDGREFLATVVRVPDVDGTWLEMETMAEHDDVGTALAAVRLLMIEVGVDDDQLTTELYTDVVREARQIRPA